MNNPVHLQNFVLEEVDIVIWLESAEDGESNCVHVLVATYCVTGHSTFGGVLGENVKKS